MDKIPVILVVHNNERLNEALNTIDHNRVELVAVVMHEGNKFNLTAGNRRIPTLSFNTIGSLVENNAHCVWLLGGLPTANIGDLWKMAKFLIDEGVPRDNIVNCVVFAHISQAWLGNLHYIKNHQVDCFATGISYTEVGLDFDYIAGARGVNLAGSNQDLRQAYLTAKHVFEHNSSVKFVIIGLTPYSFRYDNRKAFAVCSRNLQYLIALNNPPENDHDKMLLNVIGDSVRQIFSSSSENDADLNYDRTKNARSQDIPSQRITGWEEELDGLTKKFYEETVEENLDYLEQYIRLCLENHTKPVAIVFPFAPVIRRHYPRDLLLYFRQTLKQFEKIYDFTVIDLFDMPLDYEYFYNMSHLNRRGAAAASAVINAELHVRNILPSAALTNVTYEYFHQLSFVMEKDAFNRLMSRAFEVATERLRRRSRIKVGFVLYDASMWCGDELYRLFERDQHYEPTVFLCLRRDHCDEPTVVKDFRHGVEQFRRRGLNVAALERDDAAVERQDVLIFLTPYFNILPKVFNLDVLKLETLIAYIPYGMYISARTVIYNHPIAILGWKIFTDTVHSVDAFKQYCRVGFPRGFYSGYPKMDFFFGGAAHYNWKQARPNATKIIWAPHWSINDGVRYSTFHFNYKFIYDYARTHPETSWVVKPHPNLLFSAVKEHVFESDAEFEAYLNLWNNLPNARVETGAYYHDIFATSDGMILDSGSFIFEYQYTHKPMLFLTRDTQRFNRLSEELMQLLYRADGRDFGRIQQFIERILIGKSDPMAAARRKFFDEHFDYKSHNGMSASEYIFNSIDRDLRRQSF